jgi:hypothetical protein
VGEDGEKSQSAHPRTRERSPIFTELLGLGAEPEARTGDRLGSALEVVLAFTKLGLSSFGGPIVAARVISSGIHRPA